VRHIAAVGDNEGVEPSELAERLGWDIRRAQPACMYVDDMGWAKAFKYSSGSHYEVGQFCPTPKTRRVAKGQVK